MHAPIFIVGYMGSGKSTVGRKMADVLGWRFIDTDFFIEISNSLFDTNFNPLNLILPIGISFYTFENLSYTVDVYRGEFKPANKFSDYLLFLHTWS